MTLNLSMPGQKQEDLKPRITVFGVGGAGGNAVNNMIDKELDGVEFVVANTDAQALQQSKAPKRIQMDLRRSFSRQKLIDSFQKVIEKNYDDTSAFAADMETFFGYFQRDAQEKDQIIFEYVPSGGLSTILNGKRQGTIENPAFVEALWTVWFGDKPADGNLKKALLSKI